MQMRLELIPLPVSDVDRAIAFYADKLGFKKDFDVQPSEGVRIVQFTPEGSGCSVGFGTGLDVYAGEPGSVRGVHLVVRTSPRRVPSLSAEVWRSAKSRTSGAASKEQTSPILTATHSNCRRWRGARARSTRSPLTPRRSRTTRSSARWCSCAECHERGEGVVGMAVEVLPCAVVTHGGARGGVAGGDLDVTQVDAGEVGDARSDRFEGPPQATSHRQ